jgi:hypothetical protein
MENVETNIDQEHINRWQKDCQYYAEEPVTVEKVRGTLYVYGSELACRRIEYTFRHTPKGRTSFGYSKNLGTWFFGLDMVLSN